MDVVRQGNYIWPQGWCGADHGGPGGCLPAGVVHIHAQRVASSSPGSPPQTGSESSGEDWLIKPSKTEFSHNLDKEDDLKESAELMPVALYEAYPGVKRQESSDLEWLIRLRCPRAQMEQRKSDRKQSLPAVSSSLSKTDRSGQSGKVNALESWPTQKDFCAQGVVNESQDIVVSARSLLERENCLMREVDRYLKHSDFLALRRKEMLYKKWFENVSSPLLQTIQDKIDNQSSEEIEERRRKQLSLYLNYCNKKVLDSITLESYHPSFYDPFFLKTRTNVWKAPIPPLYDPLLMEIQRRYLEAGIIQQCDTGKIYTSKEMSELHKVELPLLPLSRQLMTPIEWLKIQFGYMESDVRQRSR
ncbi:hypothetical protein lerEdw1_018642 [Lerista edwardsae]|nr:hypothetical protein lerEdw1_018642 [Lerista edwardsae]